MRQTTLRDELELIKNCIAGDGDLLYDETRKLLTFYRIGSLQTLERLAEDVDEDVRRECSELLEELRK